MKLIFLNCWRGKMTAELEAFITEHAGSTDVFLFQESYDQTEAICSKIIPDYQKITCEKPVNETNGFFQTTYIHASSKLITSKVLFPDRQDIGLGIYTQINKEGKVLHLCNFHGYAEPVNKLDSPERLIQSQGLLDFFNDLKGARIIGGDFNLLPDTQSIKLFEQNGFINLIKKYELSTTRNNLAWDLYTEPEYFADYVFVNEDVSVQDFNSPRVKVSDHLPLILNFH